MPSSLPTEDERYQIGEHIAANSQILRKFLKKLTLVRIESLTCLRRNSQQQTITNTREDIDTGKDIFDISTSCILNLRPVMSIATPPSTKRLYIFAYYNTELLEIIVNVIFSVMLECTFLTAYQFSLV